MTTNYGDLPPDAISCASQAAAEQHGMGALHVGSHVLLALINGGFVSLANKSLLADAASLLECDAETLCGKFHTHDWPNCDEPLCIRHRSLITNLRNT